MPGASSAPQHLNRTLEVVKRFSARLGPKNLNVETLFEAKFSNVPEIATAASDMLDLLDTLQTQGLELDTALSLFSAWADDTHSLEERADRAEQRAVNLQEGNETLTAENKALKANQPKVPADYEQIITDLKTAQNQAEVLGKGLKQLLKVLGIDTSDPQAVQKALDEIARIKLELKNVNSDLTDANSAIQETQEKIRQKDGLIKLYGDQLKAQEAQLQAHQALVKSVIDTLKMLGIQNADAAMIDQLSSAAQKSVEALNAANKEVERLNGVIGTLNKEKADLEARVKQLESEKMQEVGPEDTYSIGTPEIITGDHPAVVSGPGFAVATDIGKNNNYKTNEDTAGFLFTKDGLEVYVVCDGMGGMGKPGSGAFASKAAVQAFLDAMNSNENLGDINIRIRDALIRANEAVKTEAKKSGQAETMMTSIIASVVDTKNNKVYFVGVADSIAKAVDSKMSYYLNMPQTPNSVDMQTGIPVFGGFYPNGKPLKILGDPIMSTFMQNHPNAKVASGLGIYVNNGEIDPLMLYEVVEVPYDPSFNNQTAVLLGSDGIIKRPSTGNAHARLTELARSGKALKEMAPEIVNSAAQEGSDDNNTAIAFYLGVLNLKGLKRTMFRRTGSGAYDFAVDPKGSSDYQESKQQQQRPQEPPQTPGDEVDELKTEESPVITGKENKYYDGVSTALATNIGKRPDKTTNDDAVKYYYSEADGLKILALADGAGSLEMSSDASQIAVIRYINQRKAGKTIIEALQSVNDEIIKTGNQRHIATTLNVIEIDDIKNEIRVVSIGDSRAKFIDFSTAKGTVLTIDQTLKLLLSEEYTKQLMFEADGRQWPKTVSDNEIAEYDNNRTDNESNLSSSFSSVTHERGRQGMVHKGITAYISTIPYEKTNDPQADRVALLSYCDGLFKGVLSEEDISALVMQGGTALEIGQRLVQAALDKNSQDNISIGLTILTGVRLLLDRRSIQLVERQEEGLKFVQTAEYKPDVPAAAPPPIPSRKGAVNKTYKVTMKRKYTTPIEATVSYYGDLDPQVLKKISDKIELLAMGSKLLGIQTSANMEIKLSKHIMAQHLTDAMLAALFELLEKQTGRVKNTIYIDIRYDGEASLRIPRLIVSIDNPPPKSEPDAF